MKQIVILSGKGGTGKTSITAAFAHLASQESHIRAVLVDADVDAANLELVLAPQVIEAHDFLGGQVAAIDQAVCAGCGHCAGVCRFEAVIEKNNIIEIDAIACEGCAACMTQCPNDAIHMEPQLAGRWFRSNSRYGPLLHAALYPAAENSGKLVTLIKQQASLLAQAEARPLVIVDGPPGVGCPVIAASSGADLAVIVAEPTAAGVHDMGRVLETTHHFGIPSLVCINKADIYPGGAAEIEAYCLAKGLRLIGRFPFDTVATEAMVQGMPVTAFQPEGPLSRAVRGAWQQILVEVYRNGDVGSRQDGVASNDSHQNAGS
jgi:MinD superfamily P-loop ATPase